MNRGQYLHTSSCKFEISANYVSNNRHVDFLIHNEAPNLPKNIKEKV